MNSSDCRTCRSNQGEQRISPGPPIHVGQFWQVEHAYPTSLCGWLVLVLKRHVEALHELRAEEFQELGALLERTVRVLHRTLACEKEYVACYAELKHFKHVHVHVVPKPADLPAEHIGTSSFALLNVHESEAVPRDEVRALCEQLRDAFGL